MLSIEIEYDFKILIMMALVSPCVEKLLLKRISKLKKIMSRWMIIILMYYINKANKNGKWKMK